MFVRVSQSYIQFSQKLLVSTIIFSCSHSGSVFHPEFCFSDEAWSLIARRNVNKFEKKNISLYFTGRTSKKETRHFSQIFYANFLSALTTQLFYAVHLFIFQILPFKFCSCSNSFLHSSSRAKDISQIREFCHLFVASSFSAHLHSPQHYQYN